MLDLIRNADWLDEARIRRVAITMLAFFIVALVALVATSDGFQDKLGRPLGSDFFAFWIAGQFAEGGEPLAAYDFLKNRDLQLSILDHPKNFFFPFWSPPAFLLLSNGLAALPYAPAWMLFMVSTFAAYIAAMRTLAPSPLALLLAVAAPAAAMNVMHGQTGFLLAALFAGAAFSLDKRPVLAGILIGLIALKPQYGLLIPFVLAITGRWRVFAAAAITVTLQCAVATAAFGAEIWLAFLENSKVARYFLLESGELKFSKIASLYSALRSIGIGTEAAFVAQGLLALIAAAFTGLLWRSAADQRLKSAGLIVASLLVTPYLLSYDLLILAPALALLASMASETGFRPYEKTAFALAWLAPLLAVTFGDALGFPFAFLALIAAGGVIAARGLEAIRLPQIDSARTGAA